MSELLPMILSVGLFFATLVIIITLRRSDRNEYRLEQVKRYVSGNLEKLRTKNDELLANITEYESRFIKAEQDAAVKIAEIEDKRETLFSHVNELVELEGTLVHYHEVLTNLSRLTSTAEQRISFVESEIEKLAEVEQMIAQYRESVAESEQNLDQIEQSIHQRISLFEQKVEEYACDLLDTTRQNLESEREEFITRMEPVLDQVRSLITPLVEQMRVHVADLGEKQTSFSTTILTSLEAAASQIEKLKGEEELLLSGVADLNSRKLSLSEDLEQLSLKVTEEKKIFEEKTRQVEQKEQELHTLTGTLTEKQEDLGALHQQVERTQKELTSLSEDIESRKENLEELDTQIGSSREEKERLEQEIEEALRIQKELKEEEELLKLQEREQVDYPDFSDPDAEELSQSEETGEGEEEEPEEDETLSLFEEEFPSAETLPDEGESLPEAEESDAEEEEEPVSVKALPEEDESAEMPEEKPSEEQQAEEELTEEEEAEATKKKKSSKDTPYTGYDEPEEIVTIDDEDENF